jgi:hypothetical protein
MNVSRRVVDRSLAGNDPPTDR